MILLADRLVPRGCLPALWTEEATDDFVLALRVQLNERLLILSSAIGLEFPQAKAIDFLERNAEASDGAINVIDDARVCRADLAVAAGNDALRNRRDGAGLKVIEERKRD